eukprot:m.1200623 g.1200623  ORF g.1200623 m.1200623 type:complete len:96 (+) comp24574_c0_seq19:2842-3129(+)
MTSTTFTVCVSLTPPEYRAHQHTRITADLVVGDGTRRRHNMRTCAGFLSTSFIMPDPTVQSVSAPTLEYFWCHTDPIHGCSLVVDTMYQHTYRYY